VRRIIDRQIFEGKPSDKWALTLHDLGHGHKEASICREVQWEHTGTMSPEAYEMYRQACDNLPPEWHEEREQANKERAARRAKTRVRRMCKVMGVDALLTLTYRENQQCLQTTKRHLKEFVRRLRRLIPGFAYVAAFERQKRGAWHVHMAIHALPFNLQWSGVKVKSYSVVRAVWRSVVGDLGGNIDQSRKKRYSRKTPAQMASYISKYILKAFEDGDEYTNRYSASACDVPKPVRLRWQADSLSELIALVYSEIGGGFETMTNPWINTWGDRFFLVAEPAPPGAIGH
jgi:hypothetical protein